LIRLNDLLDGVKLHHVQVLVLALGDELRPTGLELAELPGACCLKKAPARYARAYLYTGFDDNDTTYCIDHNLRVIIKAIDRLHAYLIRKATEVQHVESLFGKAVLSRQLNQRQLAFLSHAIRNPGELYTIESHRRSHDITYPTARSDLLKLVDLTLLEERKHGRAFVFEAVQDIKDQMKQLGE
jgi:Fic family protein